MSLPGPLMTHQYMPNILICSLVAAESNTGPQQPLAAPRVVGHHVQLADPRGFSAVHLHPHRLLHVGLQELLQLVIILVLEKITPGKCKNRLTKKQCIIFYFLISNFTRRCVWTRLGLTINKSYKPFVVQRKNEVEERLQSCLFCGGMRLHLPKQNNS